VRTAACCLLVVVPRALRYALCRFSSAIIGENLRLKILCALRLGANNSVISLKVFRSLFQDDFLLPLLVVTPLTLFSGLGPARFQGQGNLTQLFATFTFWMISFDRAILLCKESERERISPSCPQEGEKATPRDAQDVEQASGGISEFGPLPAHQTTELLP